MRGQPLNPKPSYGRWRKKRKNYAAQGKLVISLTDAKEKADQKIALLEAANNSLINQGTEFEASVHRAKEKVDQQADEIKNLQGTQDKAEEEKAFITADYEYKKDVFANFAYYNTFVDI